MALKVSKESIFSINNIGTLFVGGITGFLGYATVLMTILSHFDPAYAPRPLPE
jgi:hypothetical protein